MLLIKVVTYASVMTLRSNQNLLEVRGRCISFFQPSFFIKISWFWKNVYFHLFLCVFPSFFQKYVFPSQILLFLKKSKPALCVCTGPQCVHFKIVFSPVMFRPYNVHYSLGLLLTVQELHKVGWVIRKLVLLTPFVLGSYLNNYFDRHLCPSMSCSSIHHNFFCLSK